MGAVACFFISYRQNFNMETLTSRETAAVLNDLIKIHNDRIEGYEKAVKELLEGDKDLQLIFLKAIDQSRKIRMVLGREIETLGENIPGDTTTGGAIHRWWLDLKVSWSGHDRHAILSSCEYGEDAAQKVYEKALEGEHLPEYLSRIVLEEKGELREVHDMIKRLRDQSA